MFMQCNTTGEARGKRFGGIAQLAQQSQFLRAKRNVFEQMRAKHRVFRSQANGRDMAMLPNTCLYPRAAPADLAI